MTLAPGEIREITFHFDYDGINGYERSGFYYLTIDCTDDKQDRYPWLPITGDQVIVGEECLQNYIRSGEELYHKSKALQRKQSEMNAIHDTSSMIPREHDPNEDIYYNNDLSFPHYHQTSSEVGPENVYFPMPWEDDEDVMNIYGTDKVTIPGKGCHVTSLTQALQALGRGANPRYVNTYVQRTDNYYGKTAELNHRNALNYIINHDEIIRQIDYYGVHMTINDPQALYDFMSGLDQYGEKIEGQSDFGVALVLTGGHRVICHSFTYPKNGSFTYKDFYINDSSCAKYKLSDYFGETNDGESIKAIFLYPVNGYRFITKEFDFYDYKPVGVNGITIKPARTPEGVFLPKYENDPEYDTIITEFKDNLSFEYMGGSDLFAKTGLSHLVANTIRRTDNSEADQNYCYARWYFSISGEAQDYRLEAEMN